MSIFFQNSYQNIRIRMKYRHLTNILLPVLIQDMDIYLEKQLK